MSSTSKLVLVTGAGGFTGLALCAGLRRNGYRVLGLGREVGGPDMFQVDLTDQEQLKLVVDQHRPNVVIHLAGISSPVHGDVVEIYRANVLGSVSLLQTLEGAAQQPDLVILASSATVYDQSSGRPLAEDSPVNPVGHYAISKWTMELLAHQYAGRLPIRIVRPFNYTGPGQSDKFLVSKIVDRFASGTHELVLGAIDLVRDISSIHDVVQSYLRIIDSGPGVPLNICSGQGVKLNDIILHMQDITGRQVSVVRDEALVRPSEPRCVIGDRSALDGAIGCWRRKEMTEILAEMYAEKLALRN